jgi:RimJ/RimL family protein N-acetyltransferase
VTDRLLLTPLLVGDAEEMVEVLADPALYEFTGGEPATLDELRGRYRSFERGSGRDTELWLNWIIRRHDDESAIGTMQATVMNPNDKPMALVAWTMGVDWQGQGYAIEATIALVGWLEDHGVDSIAAHIHPQHAASAGVATRAGLRPTDDLVDGEIVWCLPRPDDQSV